MRRQLAGGLRHAVRARRPVAGSVTCGILLILLAGSARAQPAAQPVSLIDVPFISQSEALCGGAAAAMVLRYWGERSLGAESFAHLVDRSAAGIRTDALVAELRSRGWQATAVEGSDELIARELARGRPLLTLIQDRPGTFHYVVIVAMVPGAVVFHDPARAPFRVMGRDEFSRRWQAAERWMAVVLPTEAAPEIASPPPAGAGAPTASCDGLITDAVKQAQSNDLDGAERSLASALSCGGSAPLRELAGVRLLQRRWPEVEELAAAAVARDAKDGQAWRLLATSRFVQNDRRGALDAWNHVAEPRVDLFTVDGLSRTRHRPVERLVGIQPGDMLTASRFTRAERRLREVPSFTATRLEYVPVPSGLAELRATVVERPLLPSGNWNYVALGLGAAAKREVELSTGSLAGGGERLTLGWRFWPQRQRVRVALDAPAPWGGVWGVAAFAERQPFDRASIPTAERTHLDLGISNWMSSWARASARVGVDRWDDDGTYGLLASDVRVITPDERVEGYAEVATWAGDRRFAALDTGGRFRSTIERRGRVLVGRAGIGVATETTPPDLWFAGDTGHVRRVPLRAHPLLVDGALRTARLGRRITYGSIELQQWWAGVFPLGLGAAAFVDAARVDRRSVAGWRGDVDAGLGARIAVPGLGGTFRADVAKGLRDGATALSFVYEP